MAHTDGPWITSDDPNGGDGLNISDTQKRRVAHTSAVRNIRGKVIKNPIEPDEAQANARLIAAAPDLLAALERLLFLVHARTEQLTEMFGGDEMSSKDYENEIHNAWKGVRAAIAKATRRE